MRVIAAIRFACAFGLLGCGNAEQAGVEAAKQAAAQETSASTNPVQPAAPKINPPVPKLAKLTCPQVIDAAKFARALGESAPLTVVDSPSEPKAAASCSLIRGGRRPTESEQKAAKKRNGRLGVMPGDELCNVSTFCWTIEDPDRFAAKCLEDKDQLDNALGFQACIRVVATGEDDVHRYQFFDPDTKCILQVRAGPSMVDNAFIGRCAKAAYDLIGPDTIAVRPSGSGS